MRHPIEKSPRDGTAIILEDDASGTYDVAHWSSEAGEWLGENGEPTRITPTHWYPIPRDQYLTGDDERPHDQSRVGRWRRLALSIAVTLLAGALIATFFRADVAAYVTRYAGQEDISSVNKIGGYITGLLTSPGSPKSNLVAQGQVEADQASAPAEAKQAAQAQQIAAVPVAEAQRALEEDRAEGPAQEPTEVRRAVEGLDVQLQAEKSARSFEEDREKAAALALEAAAARKELAASTEQHRQALEAERARGIALARALATAQRENEKQAGLLKAGDETAQLKQAEAVKSARSLEEEREKAAAARKELAANTEQYRQALEEERERGAALARDLATAQRENEKQAAMLKASAETAQIKQAEAAQSARSFGEEREKAAALAREAAAARKELAASTEQYRQALEEERGRRAALWSELATAQREKEMQVAQLRQTGDETAQQAEAARIARSLDEERKKAAALALEAAAARNELAAGTEQYRQALEEERARGAALARELATVQQENEKQAALLKASDEAAQHRQAAESATTEPRQQLRHERDRTRAMARDLEPARRTVGVRTTPGPATSNPTSRAAQTGEVAAAAQPAAAEVKGGPEAMRLIARASVLLGQGDIGSARIVLERASETGSAKASFMLAETYDPAVLTAWGTYGTRGEVTKARELYARAHAGGILEAKNRLNALPQ
jgi:hypothetical protein